MRIKQLALSITALSFMALPCIASAESISLAKDCSDSGSVAISGSYDVVSGAVNFNLATQNCVQNGYAINGTGTVKGTFKMVGFTTNFTTDVTTAMSATFTKEGKQVQATYNNTMKGTYDVVTSKLNGTVTNSISASGEIEINIMDLITVDWADVTG